MSERYVELLPACVWDCDECGLENFERQRRYEASEEDIAEMRDELGVQPWETGEWLLRPTAVQCRHCKKTFSTKQPPDSDDEEE